VTTNFDVTRRELVLGAQNITTGWYEPTYNASTIKMGIFPKGFNINPNLEGGRYARYNLTGLACAVLKEGDQIQNVFRDYFTILSLEPFEVGDTFSHYMCELEKIPNINLVSSTYTAYPYSEPTTADDPIHRTKIWLDAYLLAAYLPAFITAYSFPTAYPIIRVFRDKAIDLIFSFSKPMSTPQYNGDKSLYGFEENVPITISAVDKDVTALSMISAAENELRRLCDLHQFGSLRLMNSQKDKTQRSGVFTLHSVEFNLIYRRTKAA
jgi:hypothetical protein